MTWFYLSLATALFWATGQTLVKKGFENISPLWNNILANLVGLFVLLIPALWLSKFNLNFPPLWLLFLIFLAAASYMTFFYAISKGKLSLTGTLVATYPVATIILSTIFLSERLSGNQILGIALALTGCIALTWPERAPFLKAKDFSWLKWGLFAAVLIGIGDFLIKISVDKIGAYSHIFFSVLVFQLLSLANYIIDKSGRRLPKLSVKKLLPTLLGVTIQVLGSFLFYLAMFYGQASLVTPVSSIYPGFMVILAVLFLKERITSKQTLGIIGIVVGIIMVGFTYAFPV